MPETAADPAVLGVVWGAMDAGDALLAGLFPLQLHATQSSTLSTVEDVRNLGMFTDHPDLQAVRRLRAQSACPHVSEGL